MRKKTKGMSHIISTLLLGQLLFVSNLVLGHLRPRGVFLILWQERLLPLEEQKLWSLDRNQSSSAWSKGSLPATKAAAILTTEICTRLSISAEEYEREVLPVEDSSFSKGKTGHKEEVKEVRTRKTPKKKREAHREKGDLRCCRLLSEVRGGLAPAEHHSPGSSPRWTDSPRYWHEHTSTPHPWDISKKVLRWHADASAGEVFRPGVFKV